MKNINQIELDDEQLSQVVGGCGGRQQQQNNNCDNNSEHNRRHRHHGQHRSHNEPGVCGGLGIHHNQHC